MRRYGGAVLVLPEPMLARSEPLPSVPGWRYELKCDGFRALVCAPTAVVSVSAADAGGI